MSASKKISYTESLAELDEILKKLDNVEMPLEELSPLVKRASSIIERCKQQLFEVDAEIQQMLDELE